MKIVLALTLGLLIASTVLLWSVAPKSTHAAPHLVPSPKFVPGGSPPQTFQLTPQFVAPPPGAPGDVPIGPTTVIIQLVHPPLVVTFQQTLQDTGSVEQAILAVRDQRSQIDNAHQVLIEQLIAPPFNARYITATVLVTNTVIVEVDASFIPQIRELPGVIAVRRDRVATLDETDPPSALGEPGLGPVLD